MEKPKKNTYLSFYLGPTLFGANVKYILEVLRNEQITDIPRSADFIKGIINFRGEIVTVVDFFKKLNMPGGTGKSQKIIIVFELPDKNKSIKIGVEADKVRKVFEMPDNQLKPVPEFGKYYNPEYLTGVAETSDGFVMLFNIEKVFSENEVQIMNVIQTKETKK
ncbi:MAG: purine-binding chemotaxis protein CheW [Bacteroidales bacterium]|nr:purine-binding chemotaxis protein CheW [Bacteroidales bacterium]